MQLYGMNNDNLKLIEREIGVSIHARGNELTLIGSADMVALARSLLEQLYAMGKKGAPLDLPDIARAVSVLRGDRRVALKEVFHDKVLVGSRARPVQPKGLAQKRYVDAIREKDIVFGIGQPAQVSRGDRSARHRLRHRPGRYRQDLPGHGHGGARAARQDLQAHRAGAPGGRSRREARLSARHHGREGQPVPAPALRRAARHDGSRRDPAPPGARTYLPSWRYPSWSSAA